MANIIELREMSDEKLREMLEDAREELFNLRFRRAASRLEDYSQLRKARREVAQLETVLHTRRLATAAATRQPDIAQALAGRQWVASSRFNYEESAWIVTFTDEDGREIATAYVNLNQVRRGRRGVQPNLVTRFELAG